MCEQIPQRVGVEDLEVLIPVITPSEPSANGLQVKRAALPGQQNLYYRLMRVFASEDTTRSILVMRLFNSLLASIVFFSCCLSLAPESEKQ